MKVYTLALGDMANCCYVVAEGNSCIVIDPAWDVSVIDNFLRDKNLIPEYVFFTHGHFDHTNNADKFLRPRRLKGYMEKGDEVVCQLPADILEFYKGSQNFMWGKTLIAIIHTPGHTRGSVCIKIENLLFTGDTLFIGSIGRTDMPGSDPAKMIKSLQNIAQLSPETIIYCGHSYGDNTGFSGTLKNEIEHNQFLSLAIKNPKQLEGLL